MNIFNQKWLRVKSITLIALVAGLSISILSFSGCSDNPVTPAQSDNFELSYMSLAKTTDATGNFVLDTVKVLIKDVKLNISKTSDSTNFKTGPYVLYLNLNSSVNIIGSGYIPVGTYDKIQFEVHVLSDKEPILDPDFVEGNNRFSVVAKGTYNGVRFVYKSDKGAKQKLNFSNALIVTETKSNVTLQIKPYIWFIDSNNRYMDPNNPNNKDLIDSNIQSEIKASFKAFKDNNNDGNPD